MPPTSSVRPRLVGAAFLALWLGSGQAAVAAPASYAFASPQRIPFTQFAEQLQRDTCHALYGTQPDKAYRACMQHDLLSSYRTDPDEHREDVQRCDQQGGVLVERIPACTHAMVHYVCLSGQCDDEAMLTPLMEAFAAVSSRCWGSWLCAD